MPKLLYERLQRAHQEGRVLDVSNLTETGHGAVVIDPPGPRSKKVGIPELPSLVSNNYESYKLATEFLGETYINHAFRYYNTYVSPSRSKSPGKKRATSPGKKRSKSPGKRSKSPEKRPVSPKKRRPTSPRRN
jgi:hypothetical protein